jgi:hypothetical protein
VPSRDAYMGAEGERERSPPLRVGQVLDATRF